MPVDMDWIAVIVSLALGGILKGATGIGAPVLAVPAMASIFGVPFAISVMVLPNFVMNTLQIWQFRKDAPPLTFLAALTISGLAGVLAGTVLLTKMPGETLSRAVAVLLLVYIGMRLGRPHWALGEGAGRLLAAPMGFISGMLQGATGLSAPASITFLNALRLGRNTFIFTISVLFTSFGVVQIPALFAIGILDAHRLFISALAIIPMAVSMPIGVLIAKLLKPAVFDRVILLVLAGIALKLIFESFGGQ